MTGSICQCPADRASGDERRAATRYPVLGRLAGTAGRGRKRGGLPADDGALVWSTFTDSQ